MGEGEGEDEIHIFRRQSGALVGTGFVLTAPAKTGGVVPSEGPLMRRRSVMEAAGGGGRDGGIGGAGDIGKTGPTSVRLRRRESPRAVVGETFGGVGLSPSGPCNLNFQIATTTLCISTIITTMEASNDNKHKNTNINTSDVRLRVLYGWPR